ncbi:hypothetical protein [Corynebacterium sp. HMSC29G08]|uniref:hypothetical protein n=1 Tax=Corynebacterium sp. HMSC29G08 TaxID=1581069 RepID=UPI001439871C|nr:hypothetical protein [Corynebacterium sp. HMSC29G08]
MYAIIFGDTYNRCVVKPAEYFGCNADGTVHGERDNHWFELTQSGQYSSPRFTP